MLCLAVLDKYGLLEENSLQGKNLRVSCPFHGETIPSLYFNMENDNYYCFGCGKQGDVISFIKDIEGISYLKALSLSSKLECIQFKEIEGGFSVDKEKEETRKNCSKNKEYFDSLPPVDWLNYKGDDPRFLYMMQGGFKKQTLSDFNIKINLFSPYPIIIPIYQFGEFKGFVRRILVDNPKDPKYLNSKGLRKYYTLMGGYEIKGLPLLICEGVLDIISAWQFGYRNAVSLLGWHASDYQVKKIKDLDCDIICALDNDATGEEGYKRLKDKFKKVHRFKFHGKKDVNEMDERTFNNSIKEILWRK